MWGDVGAALHRSTDPGALRDRRRPHGRDGLVHARPRRSVSRHRRTLPVGAIDHRARLAVSTCETGAPQRPGRNHSRSLLRIRMHGGRRPRCRLPRPPCPAMRRVGGMAQRAGRRGPSQALRGPRLGAGPRHCRASRHRIRREARVSHHSHSRLVRPPRLRRGLGGAADRRTIAAWVRPLHGLPPILPDRSDRRARGHRRPALHLVPDHRTPRPDPGGATAVDGDVGIRVRPLPGGVPDQRAPRPRAARRRRSEHGARPGAPSRPGRMPRTDGCRVHRSLSGYRRIENGTCGAGAELRHRARERRRWRCASCAATKRGNRPGRRGS